MNIALPSALRATIRHQSLGLGLLALVLFIVGNWHQAIIGFDSRFVLFAQEMLRHGPSFFPTTYGQPYADYLATSTLLTWLLSLPLGQVTSLTAWLPTAVASALIVVLVYRLTAPYSPRWGLLSIAMLLLSSTFISETRAVSLDQMLAAVALAVFYLGYAHDHFAAAKRLHWVFLLLLLGFAIRGPIGLVIPTGVLCSYYLINRQWRQLFSFGLLALALLAACVGLLLLLAKLSGGENFMHDVIRMQFLGRMDGSEGSGGVLYYFQFPGQLRPGLSTGIVSAAGGADGRSTRTGPGLEAGALLRGSGCAGDAGPVGTSSQESALHPADAADGRDHCRVPLRGHARATVCVATRLDAGHLDAVANAVGHWLDGGAAALPGTAGRP